MYNELKCTTKLTGAGGGGCAFTFFEDCNDGSCLGIEERLKIVSDKIEALKSCEGAEETKMNGNENQSQENKETCWSFQCFSSAVGGEGVLWL